MQSGLFFRQLAFFRRFEKKIFNDFRNQRRVIKRLGNWGNPVQSFKFVGNYLSL